MSMAKFTPEAEQVEGQRDLKGQVTVMDKDLDMSLTAEELRDQMTAQVKATRLSLVSWPSIQLYLILFVAYCNSWGTGFDSSIMSAMNSNSRWHKDLGIPKTGGRLGLVTAIYTVGNIAGSFIAGPASDRWGRRWGMWSGSIVALVGSVVVATSHDSSVYMVGRFLNGFGVAIVRSAAPAFVTEISPPAWRGPVTLLYNSLWLIGAILSAGIAYSTGPMKSSLSWRLPLWIQVVPSSIVVLFALFLPESPRWLIANDRYDEARKLLGKYHAGGNEHAGVVNLEMAEMRLSIGQDASDKRWWDYRDQFQGRSNRYRTFLNISMALIGQWGGSNLVTYYQANVLRSIGVTSQAQLLTYNLAYYVINLGGATIGSFASYHVGRRKLLLVGTLSMCVILVGLTACTAHFHKNEPAGILNLTIAFIFLTGFFHASGINPLVVAYPVEVLHTNTRAKGMGINNFSLNIAEFVNSYGTPVGLAKIGWKMYVIYAVWNLVQAAWVYFTFVETKGYTLEELDHIFESKHPVKESLKRANRVEPVATEDLRVMV